MPMKTLIFAVAGYNLAETGRMLEIAKAAQRDFCCVFASYGGPFEALIIEEGFTLHPMEPRLTEAELARLRVVLSGETLNTVGYLSHSQLVARVPNEIAWFQKVQPAAVLTGWCLSVALSARAAGVPFVNVLHSTSVREYYEAGLQSWPDRTNFAPLRWLFGNDEARMNRWTSNQVLKLSLPVRPYNAVGKRYGCPRFNTFIDLIEGDFTLLADIPDWVGFHKIRPSLHYIGPLPARIKVPVPQTIKSLPTDQPIVYFAMGSSGHPELIHRIIEGFAGKPYRVIAPVRSHLANESDLVIPDNVIITDFLPAHEVNPMAKISVIHGGQNTVMNACLSSTPMVGIGMHPEQQANLDACARLGFAIRLSKRSATATDVLEAIDRLIHDEEAHEAVGRFREQLLQWDGPDNARCFLKEYFG